MIETSEKTAELFEAMSLFQGQVKNAGKNAVNPHWKNKYADLSAVIEAVKEPLTEQGLFVSQFPSGDQSLTTIVGHVSGQWMKATMQMKAKDPSNPQNVGSCITYARRYALAACLGIAQEDDDGNSASNTDPRSIKKSVPNFDMVKKVTFTLKDNYDTANPHHKNYLAKLFSKYGIKSPDQMKSISADMVGVQLKDIEHEIMLIAGKVDQ